MSLNNGKRPRPVQQITDEHIRALDPMEHMRIRPGLYVGGVDTKALNNVFNEMLDYVIHHARANRGGSVKITLWGLQTLSFRDNSSIVPLHTVSNTERTWLELMMAFTGAGSRSEFVIEGEGSTFPSLTVLNALCSQMCVEIRRDDALWAQGYQKGRKMDDLIYICDLEPDEEHGTCFLFTIDDEIFGGSAFDAAWIEQRLFELACLLPNLKITFENRMTGHQVTFCAPQGLVHTLAEINREETPLHPPILLHIQRPQRPRVDYTNYPFEFEVALQFLEEPHAGIRSFANGLEIVALGPHTTACLAALTDTLLMQSRSIQRDDVPYLLAHLRLVISLWHPALSYQSQVDRRLLNANLNQPVYEELFPLLLRFFQEHPETLETLEQLAAIFH